MVPGVASATLAMQGRPFCGTIGLIAFRDCWRSVIVAAAERVKHRRVGDDNRATAAGHADAAELA